LLNDAKVRAAKPREKAYKLTDSNRLFLLVTPSGGKLWRWNYSCDGKQKSMSFGIYPMVALVTARQKRDEARAVLAEGRDPSVVKKLKIEANIEASRNTFERIAREWHTTSKPQWAAVHAEDMIRSLERDVFPSIGSLPVAELKPQNPRSAQGHRGSRIDRNGQVDSPANFGGLRLRHRQGDRRVGSSREAQCRVEAAKARPPAGNHEP